MAEKMYTATQVKELREATGAGIKDAKDALVENGGDMEKAMDWLREKGIAKAQKKLGKGRTMTEGVIETYQHHDGSIGVMVEVNCETDFVAATDQFKSFAKNIALHIVSAAPQFVTRAEIPAALVEAEKASLMGMEDLEGKPDNIKEKIVTGRMDKWFKDIVLMEQDYLLDEEKTIQQLLEETVADVGESMQISRFARFVRGEDLATSDEPGDDE